MVGSISSGLNSYYSNLFSAGSAASAILSAAASNSTTTGVDPNLIAAYYSAKAGVGASSGASGAAAATTAPTYANAAPTTAGLTSAVLEGGRFIDPAAVQLTSTSNSPTQARDYRNLFALYQGVTALQGLAQKSASAPQTEQASLQATFARGLREVQAFLGDQPFHGLTIADGVVAQSAQSTVDLPKPTNTYTTDPIYSGGVDDLPAALAGDVQFSATVASVTGTSKTVDFDLDDMGATPRTLGNVVAYLNAQLAAAGATTRFASVRIPGAPDTVQAGGQTVTLGRNPDGYALAVTSGAGETVTLAAATTRPAVYLAQTSGASAATLASTTGAVAGASDAVQQVLKFDVGAGGSDEAATATQNLSATVSSVRAQATGSDGSLYVLADLTGASPDGQPLQGASDAALLKYDSAGHLLYTRTLGAADAASGAALALSADGTQVAVVGAATGSLSGAVSTTFQQPGASTAAPSPRSFVTVYDTLQGEELWTRTTGASGPSGATAAAFAPDGTLYVDGDTSQAPGASDPNLGQAYLQSFKATSVTTFDGSTSEQVVASDPVATGSQPGDRSAGLVVTLDGGVVAATVQQGALRLQRFDGAIETGVQPTSTRDVGSLGAGGLAGLALSQDGAIVIAGATSDGDLEPDADTNGFAGGRQAFVATVAADLAPGSGDRVTYLDTGSGAATATALTVSGGEVYVAGSILGTITPSSRGADATTGFVTAVDAQTGEIGWSNVLTGADDQATPGAIAVAAQGSSVLDRLGLPQGTLGLAPSSNLVAATSVREGDQFSVRSGSSASRAVTVSADDTLSTLAAKINQALGYSGSASVVTSSSGGSELKIVANTTSSIELDSGPAGEDALAALGLTAGLVTSSSAKTATRSPFALHLSAALDISTTAGAHAVQSTLTQALATIKTAYGDLGAPATANSPAKAQGSVPSYISAQIADYQLALSRLTGA